jgi:hypothetical protein
VLDGFMAFLAPILFFLFPLLINFVSTIYTSQLYVRAVHQIIEPWNNLPRGGRAMGTRAAVTWIKLVRRAHAGTEGCRQGNVLSFFLWV